MKKKIFATILLAFAACAASAQQSSLKSAYFMGGYSGRSEFNPAFAAERSYFSLPFMGGIAVSARSNMGVNTFLYPVDGGLTTFMNSSVQASDFLGKLKDNNRIGTGVDMSMLSLGIWGKRSFFTFGVRQRVNVNANIPYSLFDFMKNAGASQYYDISDFAVNADAYTEYSFGWSRQIADRVNVGARLKFLLGEAHADARIDRMHVRMTEDRWSVNSEGTLSAAFGLLDVKTKAETGASLNSPDDRDVIDEVAIKEIDASDIGSLIGGYGAALDLGAELELIPGLRLSLAVNDLGFMAWRHVTTASTGDREWTFDGFDDVSFDDGKDNSLSDQFDALGDGLSELVKFRRTSQDAVSRKMLAMTLNAGVEYVMPFYSGLTAGVLASARLDGPYTWSEGRLYANLKPCRWFSFGVNYAVSSFGSTMGTALGFHTGGFNMFIGADSISFKYAKATDDGIMYPYGPLNVGLNFGISFNVSRRRDTAPRRALISL